MRFRGSRPGTRDPEGYKQGHPHLPVGRMVNATFLTPCMHRAVALYYEVLIKTLELFLPHSLPNGRCLRGVTHALFSRCFSELKAHREWNKGTKRHVQNLAGLLDHDTVVPKAIWETLETFWGTLYPTWCVGNGWAVASVDIPAGSLEEAPVPFWSLALKRTPRCGWRIPRNPVRSSSCRHQCVLSTKQSLHWFWPQRLKKE